MRINEFKQNSLGFYSRLLIFLLFGNLNYSTTISSAKSHDAEPAAGCQSGQLPIL